MKTFHLFLVVAVTCTICLLGISGEVMAAAEKKQTSQAIAANTADPALPADAKEKPAVPANVDINTADKDLLIGLPGIGPKTADAILAYRQENGNFKTLDELTKVKGIGDKTLAKLKPYLQEI